MQSSGQQPQEKMERENVEVEDSKDQAALPLYEFPADQPGIGLSTTTFLLSEYEHSGNTCGIAISDRHVYFTGATQYVWVCLLRLLDQLVILKCSRKLKNRTGGSGLSHPFLVLVFLLPAAYVVGGHTNWSIA